VAGAGDAVLAAVNEGRTKAGCTALSADSNLAQAAQTNSVDMARQGTLAVAEPAGTAAAIATGKPDAASTVAAWLTDPADGPHLLDCALTTAGAAEVTAGSGPWWTLFLA
jgi:uncharacterized protein YkwD